MEVGEGCEDEQYILCVGNRLLYVAARPFLNAVNNKWCSFMGSPEPCSGLTLDGAMYRKENRRVNG